ncbi:MAG: hypothetical protein A2X23_11440 [Chloroflexi bacterium GWC2_73_18]|nr:MAG: hypothetical protein A2X23_11440 [Chloroflexi bacterium GWC2_73_18]
MEYQVRHARITDAERISALLDTTHVARGAGAAVRTGAADLLRQLVHLPHAVVLVADADRRIVGAAVMALRPSVRQGGFVGSIDLLVVDPASEGGVADALIVELLRSARNKGCVAVEVALPDDQTARARWSGHGFEEAGPHVVRALTPVGAGRS